MLLNILLFLLLTFIIFVIYRLYNPKSPHRSLLYSEKGKNITIETALDGMGIPLHPGAQRYYEEKGVDD